MDFEGRLIQFLGEQSGVSKAGKPWKKKEWVFETFGNFTRKIKVQAFNDRCDQINLEPGKDYVVFFDLESREFNGRWYTDVSIFRVQELQGGPTGVQPGGFNPGGGYNANTSPQSGFVNQPYGGNSNFGQPTPSFEPPADDSDEDLPF